MTIRISVSRKRFQNVVAGAGLHGLHCGLNTAEGSHHDYRQRCVLVLNTVQELQSIHARKFQISQNEIDGVFAQQLQAGLSVFGGERRESVVAEIQLEQAAHLGLIFDDQNRRHEHVSIGSMSFTKSPGARALPPRLHR